MEIRLLQSFLAIAEEGSITRAAELLHITQPALSRQLVALETELGCDLFHRGKKRMELTDEGLLLQRRAEEIVSLVALTEEELAGRSAELDGHISIGAGELDSTPLVVDLAAAFAEEHPLVTFDLFSGIADEVSARLDRGLLDFGLLLEPVDVARYEFVKVPVPERWVAVVSPHDDLAQRDVVRPADLEGRTISLPYRLGVKSILSNWLGASQDKADCRFSVNLGGIAASLVEGEHAAVLCVEGCAAHWDPARFAIRPLEPKLAGASVLAWKRGMPHTAAVQAFVEFASERLRALADELRD